ncbi:MAG: hypothetical protein ACLFP6_12530 [Spirochaetaceae bacterium]
MAGYLAQLRERIKSTLASLHTYEQLTSEPGVRPEFVTRLYARLRAQGVRAKYRVIGTGGGATMGGISHYRQTVEIQVHKEDLHKARRIMTELRRSS